MRYDTARSSSWGWAGLPNPRSLLRHSEPCRRGPQVALFSWLRGFSAFSEANPLTEQNITDLYNLSPGENKKTVIVRPASSVVFSLYLHKWLLKDSCVSATSASRSIHLCSVEKPLLFRAQPTLKQVAFLLVNWTHTSVLLPPDSFMLRCFL